MAQEQTKLYSYYSCTFTPFYRYGRCWTKGNCTGLIGMLYRNEIEGTSATLSIYPDREAHVNFSEPCLRTPLVIWSAQNSLERNRWMISPNSASSVGIPSWSCPFLSIGFLRLSNNCYIRETLQESAGKADASLPLPLDWTFLQIRKTRRWSGISDHQRT